MESLGKALGIDYGTKRIGLAISDEEQRMAWELSIVSPDEFWKTIESIIVEQGISDIVIGLPLNMSGEFSEKTEEVKKFAEKVKEISGLPVHLIDERLSSQMAESIIGNNSNLDSLAAQILLQNYLNKQQN